MKCARNTCDRWKLTIVTVGSVGAVGAGLFIAAQLEAGRNCCMDYWTFGYKFEGIGIGCGAKFAFTVSGDGKWFDTPCISWGAHEGFGRATAAGIGAWWTYGILWIKTPQTYLFFHGWGRGFDSSGVTATGFWYLDPGIVGR